MSPPLPDYGNVDLRVHNWVDRPNLRKAAKEHEALVRAMAGEGARIHVLDGDPRFPNHIYPRDAAVVGPSGAWLSRFGLASRRGEELRVASMLESLGVPIVGRTRGPGTFEGGGDAFLLKGMAFVGSTERTNEAGAKQVGAHLLREGYRVRVVPVRLSFHMLEPVDVIDDRTLLLDERWLDEPSFRGYERIPVPADEVGGGNVLVLGPRKVVIHAGYPKTVQRLEKSGVDVLPVELTELKKAGGGPECLTLPVCRG